MPGPTDFNYVTPEEYYRRALEMGVQTASLERLRCFVYSLRGTCVASGGPGAVLPVCYRGVGRVGPLRDRGAVHMTDILGEIEELRRDVERHGRKIEEYSRKVRELEQQTGGLMEWHDLSKTPPDEMIWVTNGTEVRLVHAGLMGGVPINTRYWARAKIPVPPC